MSLLDDIAEAAKGDQELRGVLSQLAIWTVNDEHYRSMQAVLLQIYGTRGVVELFTVGFAGNVDEFGKFASLLVKLTPVLSDQRILVENVTYVMHRLFAFVRHTAFIRDRAEHEEMMEE